MAYFEDKQPDFSVQQPDLPITNDVNLSSAAAENDNDDEAHQHFTPAADPNIFIITEAIKNSMTTFASGFSAVLENNLKELRSELSLQRVRVDPCNQGTQQQEDMYLSGPSAYSSRKRKASGKSFPPNKERKINSKRKEQHSSSDEDLDEQGRESDLSLHAGSDIEEVFKNLTKQTNVAGEDGLQFFLKDYDTDEKLAPPVSDEMAKAINLFWKNKLPADKLKPRLDKVSRPSNLNIQVKKCNEEIWALQNGQMGRIRSSDIKMQSIQMALSKAIIPIIRLADDCVKAKDDKNHLIDAKTALEACMDSIVLLANSNSQVDYFRRDQFKSILPEHLRPIVTHPTDATTLLFGENLDEQIKQITEKSKIKNSLSAGKKFSPQSRQRTASDKGPNYSSKSQNRFSKNYHSFPKNQKYPTPGKQQKERKWEPSWKR